MRRPIALAGFQTAPAQDSMTQLQEVVGLFGSIAGRPWRDEVIPRLEQANIAYFNPVVASGWTPAHAEIEAHHLATDRAILFVITGDSESYGSLAETGWAALTAVKNKQKVVFVIEDYPGSQRSAANRARILVRTHAEKAGVPIYDDLDTAVDEIIKVFT